MAGVVMQHRNGIELLAEFRHRRIIDTEEDRLILQGRGNQAARQLRRLQAERTARHRFIPKRPIIAVQAVMRHMGQEILMEKGEKMGMTARIMCKMVFLTPILFW